MEKAWFQSRYDKVGPGGTGKDYINCAMDEALYNRFVDALIEADAMTSRTGKRTRPISTAACRSR
jgi:methylenetetrahydrofolate--tRNA-(uracil-5-)-methyltransferase